MGVGISLSEKDSRIVRRCLYARNVLDMDSDAFNSVQLIMNLTV